VPERKDGIRMYIKTCARKDKRELQETGGRMEQAEGMAHVSYTSTFPGRGKDLLVDLQCPPLQRTNNGGASWRKTRHGGKTHGYIAIEAAEVRTRLTFVCSSWVMC
jgi:hypothetical protein